VRFEVLTMYLQIKVTFQAIVIFENRSTRRRICQDVTLSQFQHEVPCLSNRGLAVRKSRVMSSGWCFRVVVIVVP
jgi:hypothetical protein